MSTSTALLSWLRKTPQPASVKVKTDDGETHTIDINAKSSTRWRTTEQSIMSCGSGDVQCLSKDGKILRARKWEFDDGGDEETTDTEKAERRRAAESRAQAVAQASMLDRYGERLNEAFERGAAAAGVSQDSLVSLVGTLTEHLSLAITNLHNVSVNLANIISQSAGEGEGNSLQEGLMAKVLGGVAVKAMGLNPGDDQATNGSPAAKGAKKP